MNLHAACFLWGRMVTQGGKGSACPEMQIQGAAVIGGCRRLPMPRARFAWLIAIFLAVLHAFLAVTAVNTKSPTFDEPQHLTAGYSYWATGDFRLDPENGDLPAMWAALPLVFGNTKFIPLNDRGWQRAEEGRTAHQFFYEVGNDPDGMIAQARIMMSIFGAALCLLVYRIGREFFGLIGGLIAEILTALDPNFLAHSPLVDSDVPAAFFFAATVWTSWRLFQKITAARLLVAALSLSGLFLTKFSAPIVLPVVAAMSVLKIFSRSEIALRFVRFQTVLKQTWKKACVITTCLFALGTILFIAIWGSCSFRYEAWTDHRDSHEGTSWHWNYLLENSHAAVLRSVGFARAHRLLPEAYLYGLAYVRKHEIDRPAFLDNQWSIVGFPLFFPLAFLYKTPLPMLLLLALAIYAAIANRQSWKIENILNPLWAFTLVYGAFAITAQLNIGHRHLLPIYPALFVACGAVAHLLRDRRRAGFAAATIVLLSWHVTESSLARPDYLAYFNQIGGGPSRGYQHLVDSSLDWGQDLPALKKWINDHPALIDQKRVYLAYFGTADPRAYEINAEAIVPESQFSPPASQLAGGIYCISATTLQSVYALEIGPWCAAYEARYQSVLAEIAADNTMRSPGAVVKISNASPTASRQRIKEFQRMRQVRLCAYLRHHSPVTQIGNSIFVFDLTDEEVNHALFGPPAELRPEIAVIGY